VASARRVLSIFSGAKQIRQARLLSLFKRIVSRLIVLYFFLNFSSCKLFAAEVRYLLYVSVNSLFRCSQISMIIIMMMVLVAMVVVLLVSYECTVSAKRCLTGDGLPTSVDRSYYEELVQFATCPSCAKITSSTKILPCMDYCCLPCLQQQQQLSQQHSFSEINCPSCSETFPVPQQGLEYLPSNAYVRPIVPARTDGMQYVPRRDKHETSCCSVCSAKNRPTTLTYCKECSQCLCERCAEVHRNLRSTKGHHVVEQRQRLLVDCDCLACSVHPTKNLQIFCTDCITLCCVTCLREVHHDHNWCDVDQVSQTFRQQLGRDVETVRRAANWCQQETQQLDDAEKMLIERVRAVQSQADSQRDYLIDAVDRELAQLHDILSQAQNSNVEKLQQAKERIRKQQQILQSFEKFCQTVVETGTVQEVIHVHSSIHKAGEELPLQEVSSDAEISELRFAPVNLHDFLPEEDQRLIGSVLCGQPEVENVSPQPTWNQLQSQLHQTLEQADQLQRQMDDNRRRMTCLEEQLAEKTALLEKSGKELEDKKLLVDELERQRSDMASAVEEKENAISRLQEELQQSDITINEYWKQVEGLGQQLLDTQENYENRLHECESKFEKTALDLNESERLAAEYRTDVDQLNIRVQQLQESLSYSVDKEEQMETQLEEAWQQISEQSVLIEHVPPTAGKS